MKTKLSLLIILISSCSNVKHDYTNQIFISEIQTYQLKELNNELLRLIKRDESIDLKLKKIEEIDSIFDVITDELIVF